MRTLDLAKNNNIPKEFLRGGFESNDQRRPSLFVGVCLGGLTLTSRDNKNSLGMLFDDG